MRECFCTCGDRKCPNHPSNHDRGCDLCVQKCLKLGEIPSCFFKLVDEDLTGVEDFTLSGFARFFAERGKREG